MWVFGYGSLIWNPGFKPEKSCRARLHGYARDFCLWSTHYRGTPDNPGLVLALEEKCGASCEGVALRLPRLTVEETLRQLRDRELITNAYLERQVQIDLNDGGGVQAITYVIDPQHHQYCRHLGREEKARIIASRRGASGENAEYLARTATQLRDLGIQDETIEWMAHRVKHIRAGRPAKTLPPA